MKAILSVAAQEILISRRNRWVFAMTGVMLILAVSLVLLGSGPSGTLGVDPLSVLTVSLSSLSVFLVPLIALLVTYDSIVGEVENGTMLLLLSYPISRAQVVLGKFLGLWLVTCLSIFIGFGAAVAVLAIGHDAPIPMDAYWSFGQLLISACLLSAVFLSLGLWASSIAAQRGSAAALVIGLWLLFVVVFDLVLLGGLILGLDDVLSESALSTLLLLNPGDAFRILNSGHFAESAVLSSSTTVDSAAAHAPGFLWASLFAWLLIPLSAAMYFFKRREI